MFEDGLVPQEVKNEVRRLVDSGHEVMLATGRGAPITLPVVEKLDIQPQYLVCANGAVILVRDEDEVTGYRRAFVKTFDARDLLVSLFEHVPGGNFAVENEHGFLHFTKGFDYRGVAQARKVEFDELLSVPATRVILVSEEHTSEEFTEIVAKMGMHEASYSVGWTAWLDITPHGVNKATALEQVRLSLGIEKENVYAIGDGRNDVEMLQWAAEAGRSAVMSSAPDEVHQYASEITDELAKGGSAKFLASIT